MRRSAEAYPDAPAIIFDEQVWSWRDVFFRCRKIAGALRAAGLTADSTVAVLCRNIPAAVELSYAVPMSRSVLNMINTRLDAAAIAFILEHGEAEVFFVDSALADIAHEALLKISADPIVVCIPNPQNAGAVPGGENYEDFIEKGEPVAVDDIWPANEWDAITLNYTSGTTGNPKASSVTTAGHISMGWVRRSSGRCRCTQGICGPCHYSIATVGVFPGPSRRGRASMSV